MIFFLNTYQKVTIKICDYTLKIGCREMAAITYEIYVCSDCSGCEHKSKCLVFVRIFLFRSAGNKITYFPTASIILFPDISVHITV